MRTKRGSLPLLVLTLLLSGVLETLGESKPLLVPTRRQGSLKLKPDATVIRQTTFVVDFGQLKGRDNRRLELPLFDGAKIVLIRDEEESGPSGVFVWEGEVEGQPGSMAILAATKDVLIGDVMTRDSRGTFGFYQIRYLGKGVHVLKEVDQSKFPEEEGGVEGRPSSRARQDSKGASGFFPARYPRNGAHPLDAETPLKFAAERKSGHSEVLFPPPDPCDPASRIDALVVYTDAARDAAGGKDAIRLLIESAVRSTNRSYRKSEVTQRLRLVHLQRVEYPESGNSQRDWDRLQNTSDRYLTGVLDLRDAHAADVVVLIVNKLDDCGRSKVMPTVSEENEKKAYAVVAYDCAGLPKWSFAHELGHVMGARHNRPNNDGHGPFSYNYGYVRPSPTAGSWHTIMAKQLPECGSEGKEPCTTRIPWWSNPDVDYPNASGDPTGNGDHDNHQALEETALTVANYRCASP